MLPLEHVAIDSDTPTNICRQLQMCVIKVDRMLTLILHAACPGGTEFLLRGMNTYDKTPDTKPGAFVYLTSAPTGRVYSERKTRTAFIIYLLKHRWRSIVVSVIWF